MDYGIHDHGDTKEISLSGRLTFADNKAFRNLVSNVEGTRRDKFVFDLGNLEYIDSAGLGMLILARDAAASQKKELRLCGAKGQVQQMLKISKFSTFMNVDD